MFHLLHSAYRPGMEFSGRICVLSARQLLPKSQEVNFFLYFAFVERK